MFWEIIFCIYLKILLEKSEAVSPKVCVGVLISFDFWGCSVICWPVFCAFFDRSYSWSKRFLGYSFYIISNPLWQFFLTEISQIIRSWIFVDRQRFHVSIWDPESLQKYHPWFFSFQTSKHEVSTKTLFWTRPFLGKLILIKLDLYCTNKCNLTHKMWSMITLRFNPCKLAGC